MAPLAPRLGMFRMQIEENMREARGDTKKRYRIR